MAERETEADETEPRFQMTLRLPESMHARLKVAARRDRRNLTRLIEKILADWLDEHENEGTP
jgi:predicted HicB family RNase H-like nuclease